MYPVLVSDNNQSDNTGSVNQHVRLEVQSRCLRSVRVRVAAASCPGAGAVPGLGQCLAWLFTPADTIPFQSRPSVRPTVRGDYRICGQPFVRADGEWESEDTRTHTHRYAHVAHHPPLQNHQQLLFVVYTHTIITCDVLVFGQPGEESLHPVRNYRRFIEYFRSAQMNRSFKRLLPTTCRFLIGQR